MVPEALPAANEASPCRMPMGVLKPLPLQRPGQDSEGRSILQYFMVCYSTL